MVLVMVVMILTLVMFFGFYLFSLDFLQFSVYSNFNIFFQSEIVNSRNFSMVEKYLNFYNKNEIGNNDFSCYSGNVYEDDDCIFRHSYGFLPPSQMLDLGYYNLNNDSNLSIIIKSDNSISLDYNIFNLNELSTINGTISDNAELGLLKKSNDYNIRLLNNSKDRIQFFLLFSGVDGVKNINVDNSISNIVLDNTYNLKYGKGSFLNTDKVLTTNIDFGLKGYWNMENLSGGYILDNTLKGNNLSCFGSGGIIDCGDILNNGVSGNGLLLNGINNFLDFGTGSYFDIGKTDFSISFWINLVNTGSLYTLFHDGLYSNIDNGYLMSILSGGNLDLIVGNGMEDYLISSQETNSYLKTGRNHIVWNFDFLNYSEIHINGILDPIRIEFNNEKELLNSSNLIFGNFNNNNFYNGYIDEIRLFDRKLRYVEIKEIYESMLK